jgi:hypothetical protein
MGAAFLIQLLISAVAVAALVGLAAWLGVPRVTGAMTEDQVRALLAEEHPDLPIDRISLEPDGKSAIATSGARAMVVKRIGDGHVVEAAA